MDLTLAMGLAVTALVVGAVSAGLAVRQRSRTAARLQVLLDAQKRHEEELQRAREVAERATESKTEFLARMSHEFLTPMNGIIGMTEFLLGTTITSQQRECLQTTSASAKNLLGLLDDILDFARAGSGQLRMVSLPFGLRHTLGELLRPLGMQAQAKGMEMMLLVEPDVPDRLVGDARRLRQLLGNLVTNAIKFSGDGEVFIWVKREAVSEEGATLRFSVADTGIGIPLSRRAEIFQPFTQATLPNVVATGTGLGLAICSHLVRQMGGRIWFESEIGQGSQFTFEVRLPFQPDPQPIQPLDLEDLPALVVDRSARHRHVLAETLRSWKGRSHGVADVEAALESLSQSLVGGPPVGLLVLDADLPGAGRILQELDARPALAQLPCVLLTSWKSEIFSAHQRFCVRVSKPVLATSLQEGLQSLLSGETVIHEASPAFPIQAALREPTPAPRADVSPRGDLEALTPMRVLVVDDNPVNRKVAMGLLEQAGHRATPAEHGSQALEILEQQTFDLILMDVEMPNIDGIDATQLIRAREEVLGGHIPIVALTAFSTPEDKERCREAGMDDHLSKPLNPAELVRIVRQLLPQNAARPANLTLTVQEDRAPASGTPPVDLDQLKVQVGGSQELLRELVEVFLSDMPEMMGTLENSLRLVDAKAVATSAHKLKGALLSLAAGPASEYAMRLEALGRAATLEQAVPLLPQLRAELDAVQAALRSAAAAG